MSSGAPMTALAIASRSWTGTPAGRGRFRSGIAPSTSMPTSEPTMRAGLVVTYSRCRKEPVALFNGQWPDPEPARRCRLYQLVIGARRPSALGPEPPAGHVYLTPSRWRDRLAFLDWRAHPKRATVRWMRLGATGGRRRYTVPVGRQGDEFGAGPSTIDLRGTRIAYDWHADLPDDVVRCPHSSGDPTLGVDEYDVFAGRLPSMVGRLEQGCTFDAIQQAHSPSVPDSPGPVPYLISGPPHDFTPQLRTRSGAAVTDRAIWPTGSIVDSISLDAGLIALSQSTDGAHWQVVVTRR